MTRHLKAATPFHHASHPTAEQNSVHAALLRPDISHLSELRSDIEDAMSRQQEAYANLTQEAPTLLRDLRDKIRSEIEATVASLREGLPSSPHDSKEDGEEDEREERHVETVVLGDTDEDIAYEDMGDAALELRLSADEIHAEYHGEFRFDGSGPSAIETFESDDPDPSFSSPSGNYHLPNSESVSFFVAEDTGFRGTVHADAARSLEVEAPGWFSGVTLHGASLTEATFNVGMLSMYEDDLIHGGTYHSVQIDAENLETLTVLGDARFRLNSIADSDVLQRVEANTDGEFLLSGFELDHLEEVDLSGGGRVVISSDMVGTQVDTIRVDAADLHGDVYPLPPGEDALSLWIGAFDGSARGTAEIAGSEVGQNSVRVAGRDLTYTGGEGSDYLSYRDAGELDDMASFRIEAPSISASLTDVVGRGEFALEDGSFSITGNSLVQTEHFFVLSGSLLHPESDDGAVRILSDGEVTLYSGARYATDMATYNDAYFARDTGESRWSLDEEDRFDGTFDFMDSVTNDDTETLDGLLFEDDAGDLFYVLDTDTDPGIEQGADAFRIAEVGNGWVDDGSVQSAADVNAFIDSHALALLGVGETTLAEHGELA
ncbi:hypothetical protein ACOJCM_00245 [Billgrantia sp. LNSP4103-1]|uniref:hypothetical protein n=1 Tax=Billgrantia sp. LNSP4103-1 TaxID=3410266 RepID=UPI00403EFBEB